MKKALFLMALSCLLVLAVLLVLGFSPAPEEWEQEAYVVGSGDTLYSIAVEHGISDWRKWCYEVCRLNNIEDGGTICTGDEIIIYVRKDEC